MCVPKPIKQFTVSISNVLCSYKDNVSSRAILGVGSVVKFTSTHLQLGASFWWWFVRNACAALRLAAVERQAAGYAHVQHNTQRPHVNWRALVRDAEPRCVHLLWPAKQELCVYKYDSFVLAARC